MKRVKHKFTQYNNSGTMLSVEQAIMESIPASVNCEFVHKRSRSVAPGTLQVTLAMRDPRPWWKFWS